MANLLQLIKQAAKDAVEASNPVQVHFGTVLSEEPLEVQVDQRFILPAAALVVPESLGRYEGRGLTAGDRVLLIRVQGGEKYVILDRVVSGG